MRHPWSSGARNCHPFCRELFGIPWCFAHNGTIPSFAHQRAGHHVLLGKTSQDNLAYHEMGDTDSESVFCAILNALWAEFKQLPTLPILFNTLQRLVDELSAKDNTMINNFLLACGPCTVFCYSWPGQMEGSRVWNGLHYIVCKPPLSRTAHLVDAMEYSLKFDLATDSDRMSAIATQPLRNEDGWVEMKRGELVTFHCGIPYTDPSSVQEAEVEGHGLVSRCFRKG